MPPRTPLFVANWKMNMLTGEALAFAGTLSHLLAESGETASSVWLAPPLTALPALGGERAAGFSIGSQNCHWLDCGPHTGEVSASMLKEHGAKFAIVGHSERRQFYGETDAAVSRRAQAALNSGLSAIVCIGESKHDFESDQSLAVVTGMLLRSLDGIPAGRIADNLVVAYEPVWAIGTGLSASPEYALRMHRLIRELLSFLYGSAKAEKIPIIYGGSATPENIGALLAEPNVDGVLVGSASLNPEVFFRLIRNGRLAVAERLTRVAG